MKPPRKSRPQGQVRQSQVVTTFGPGSMIDLPNHSVIVGGLDTWEGERDEVHEPRLLEKLREHFRAQGIDAFNLRLMAPPAESDDPSAPRRGITVFQFPEWFISQISVPYRGGRARRLVHRTALEKKSGRFIDEDKLKHTVVPIRFVRACARGHISDIDWKFYAHGGDTGCNKRQLWIDESGTSGDLTELRVRCECGEGRSLAIAQKSPQLLRTCNGERPWLGLNHREGCGQPSRLLVRSASNAYFSQVMSVISLPPQNESLTSAVDAIYHLVEGFDEIEDLQFARRKQAPVKNALDGLADEEVWREIQIRKGLIARPEPKSVKHAEFEILSQVQSTTGRDSDMFSAEALNPEHWSAPWMKDVERVVLVHRLREVVAQLGFTRFEASTPDVEGELQIGVTVAPLARELSWLPAIENRGEGVFIQFRKSAIDTWLQEAPVKRRYKRLLAGYDAWRAEHSQSRRAFPGLAYYLLHTISHTLLTAVSLDCGYPSSSLRERVYASESGYGILLYTGTPDSEGTLGGLVDVGRRIHHHLRSALDYARLCSNDPVCTQHDPATAQDSRYLHGAACHGCLLISETSCEQQNDFLDRALIVATVEDHGSEFFPE